MRERADQVKDWVEAKVQVRAHEIFTVTKRTDEQANYYEAKQQVEEAWQHFTTLEAGGTVTSGQWAVMKLGLSSHEYSRALALQGTAMTQAELLELTVGDFDKHRKRAQMDWANASFDDPTRKAVWEIVDWGLDGLAAIKLADVVAEAKKLGRAGGTGRTTAKRSTASSTAARPSSCTKLASLPDVLRQGKWVKELTTELTGPRIRAVMPRESSSIWWRTRPSRTALVDYYTTRHPDLRGAGPAPIRWRSSTLVKDREGEDLRTTPASSPISRNFHKFPRASLDKLKVDQGHSGEAADARVPVASDHNGAFVRHAHVNKRDPELADLRVSRSRVRRRSQIRPSARPASQQPRGGLWRGRQDHPGHCRRPRQRHSNAAGRHGNRR